MTELIMNQEAINLTPDQPEDHFNDPFDRENTVMPQANMIGELTGGVESGNQTEYKLLTGHPRTDSSFKSSEQLRAEYVELTDGLIYQMTDGVEVTDRETGEKVKKIPDVVVWLDKSARPTAWLAKELWPTLAANARGDTPKMPDFKFANIDREQWVNVIDPKGIGSVDLDQVDASIIRSLRSIFVSPAAKKEGLSAAIDTAETYLDGKTVMIVDEVRSTGRTLGYATKLFQKAFPDTNFGGTYWMSSMAVKGMATGNADLPVWYQEKIETGRGVGNRNDRLSSRSFSSTQRLGAWFLSTRFQREDPTSRQLRKEIHQLGEDVRAGEVLIVPSLKREEEDYLERATRLNGMEQQEFIARKNLLKAPKRQ